MDEESKCLCKETSSINSPKVEKGEWIKWVDGVDIRSLKCLICDMILMETRKK